MVSEAPSPTLSWKLPMWWAAMELTLPCGA